MKWQHKIAQGVSQALALGKGRNPKSPCLPAVVPGVWDEGGKVATDNDADRPSVTSLEDKTRHWPFVGHRQSTRAPLQGAFVIWPFPRAKSLGYSVLPFHGRCASPHRAPWPHRLIAVSPIRRFATYGFAPGLHASRAEPS
jgi:hypothetical protein